MVGHGCGTRRAMRPVLMVCVASVTLAACGSSGGTADAGELINAPTMQGPHAFVGQQTLASTQTSGGGAHPGDNLSLTIGNTCGGGFPDQEVQISLFTADNSALTAQTYTIAAGSNLVRLSYNDRRPGGRELSAISGTVVMHNVDFTALQNNRGSYQVTLSETDGGTSSLSGTFDGRYLCR